MNGLKKGNKSVLVISVVILIGMILGNLAGDALTGLVPFFSKTIPLGLDNFSLKLYVLDFHIGCLFNVNVLGLIGGMFGLLTAIRY